MVKLKRVLNINRNVIKKLKAERSQTEFKKGFIAGLEAVNENIETLEKGVLSNETN